MSIEEGEMWKDLPKYEGLYQVSNLGRVKSLSKKLGRPDSRNKQINRRDDIILKSKRNPKNKNHITASILVAAILCMFIYWLGYYLYLIQ